MMISRTTRSFREQFAALPKSVQEQARKKYRLFSRDPHHPSLQFKKLQTVQPIYSARINNDYRVVGIFAKEEIIWFWCGSHADYESLLKQLS